MENKKQITYKSTLTFRRGTAAEWAEIDPILKIGEPGYAFDIKILKVGDGENPWSELPAFTSSENSIYEILVDGTPVDITSGVASIGIGTEEIAGVVYSSSDDNCITITEDGVMEINNLSTSKLLVEEGDILILNCGDAE